MPPCSLLPTSSSSSSSTSSIATTSGINFIQDRLMKDLSRLGRMLQRIQAVLHDAEEREIYDHSIQLWLSELREVAYDVEDVLDEYDYQVIKTQLEGIKTTEAEPSLMRKRLNEEEDDEIYGYQESLPSSNSVKIPISCNMAKRIIDIIEKFDEIMKDRVALQLREEDGLKKPNFDVAMKRPPSSSLMHDFDVIGREDDKKKIIQLLLSDSEKENTIIPIVGLGGVGKTTLAQLVYNDHMICKHFSLKVWVCISEEFNVMRVTKEIAKSIIGSDNHNLNDLQCMLKKAILGKRFLFVLDDIWNERLDLWEALQAPFCGIGMGKIIVTTRSKSVTRIMQTVPSHELGCLDEEQSWSLFQRHAFCGWELDQQLNFEKIGRQITKKCGGLPLALKTIGGFLRYEVDEQTWSNVLENDIWELEGTKNLIFPALKISYNHLPSHLKPCFVYASLFPKNYVFEKEELIRLWIAHGYIQLTGRKRLLEEDLAFEYFEELQRRSFFQLSKHGDFILHDMVHDLARFIAKNEICSLLDFDELKNIHKDAKHIFIKQAKVHHFPSFGAIRTFSYFDHDSEVLHQSNFLNYLFPYFGCLRVLRIEAPKYPCNLQFVDRIGNLQHLRYLSMNVRSVQMEEQSFCSLYKLQTLKLQSFEQCKLPSALGKLINLRHLVLHCDTEMLPKSISQLENLLTLDIQKCCQLRELPSSLSKLINLRHLMIPIGKNFCIPRDIEKLINLQTLSHYHLKRGTQHCDIGWLKDLVNLRGSLLIFELQNVKSRENAERANLKSKPHIKSLKLYWTEVKKDDECVKQEEEEVLDGLQPHTNVEELAITGYDGKSFPSWFGNPHFSNLTAIRLQNFNNNEECNFLPLSKLPSLKLLFIINIKGIKRMGNDFWCYTSLDELENNFAELQVGFPSLEVLSIEYMPEWEEWPTIKKGDFPSLKILNIKNCPKLELLPTLPSSVEEFEVKTCESLKYLALHSISGSPRLQKVVIECCLVLRSVKQVPELTHLEISHCCNLKSVNRLDNLLATLKVLMLFGCPLLQLNPDESSHHSIANLASEKGKLERVHVVNCPQMRDWCQWNALNYSEMRPHWNPSSIQPKKLRPHFPTGDLCIMLQ
ncbi:hypothetical protein M5K25_021752 [Dendrobium thyrsiflorum]|uniref:Disease resistance protein RGA3 n=1 Tax=Dendrobium thyrsiflorum TaxID=117978 RepID=A0ABD0UAY9_DENTH